MAKIRIGFSTHFEVENELVGIGTDNPTNTKQVLGNIHATNAKAVGVSTLATYQGFLDKEARFGKSSIDINSQAGTLGEIVIDGEVTVSSGSTLCSGVDELTLTDSFSVPTGNTDSRIHCQTAGSMRFNEDFGTLEFYTGDEWRTVNSFVDTGNRGRGLNGGGAINSANQSKIIEYIQIQTLGNSQSFGELNVLARYNAAVASSTRGLFAGGIPNTDTIDYVTIASEGNAIDFGNLQNTAPAPAGLSSQTRGLFAGGYSPVRNTIDYVEISTLGNAADFGDLFTGKYYGSGCASPVRGIFQGVTANNTSEGRYQYVTIASKGNSTEWGRAVFNRTAASFASNSVRGILAGGVNATHPWFDVVTDSIEYITIASTGTAEYFGDLGHYRSNSFNGSSTSTRAVFCGGSGNTTDSPNSTLMDTCEYVEIASSGNAQDFGNLSQPRRSFGQCSDSHGGLGGY